MVLQKISPKWWPDVNAFGGRFERYAHSMRQIHYAGDKLFVDFSGLTIPVVDAITGEVKKAQIFVAVPVLIYGVVMRTILGHQPLQMTGPSSTVNPMLQQ